MSLSHFKYQKEKNQITILTDSYFTAKIMIPITVKKIRMANSASVPQSLSLLVFSTESQYKTAMEYVYLKMLVATKRSLVSRQEILRQDNLTARVKMENAYSIVQLQLHSFFLWLKVHVAYFFSCWNVINYIDSLVEYVTVKRFIERRNGLLSPFFLLFPL